MTTVTETTYGPDGEVVDQRTVEHDDPPSVADRVAELERRANAASAAPDLDSVKAKLGGQ